MKAVQVKITTIDEYMATYTNELQIILRKLRAAIQKTAPDVEEKINCAIPTFTFNGNLVHFVADKNHIAFYLAPPDIKAFAKELSKYEGSIKFPIEKPLPFTLISKIVKFRVKENTQRKVKPKKPK